MAKADVPKTPTGIKGLDSILGGGIPTGDQVLVSGPPGSGKTILGLQFIYEGCMQGEPGLYVTLDSDHDYLLDQARGLGFDLASALKKDHCAVVTLDPSDIYRALDDLEQQVKKMGAKRLVVDSLSILSVYASSYRNLPEDLIAFLEETKHAPPITLGDSVQKQMIYYVLSRLRKLGCTTLLTSELARESEWYSRDTISEFSCDGIFLLDQQILGEQNSVRTLAVVKMRRTGYKQGVYEFEIQPVKGITLKTAYEEAAAASRHR